MGGRRRQGRQSDAGAGEEARRICPEWLQPAHAQRPVPAARELHFRCELGGGQALLPKYALRFNARGRVIVAQQAAVHQPVWPNLPTPAA